MGVPLGSLHQFKLVTRLLWLPITQPLRLLRLLTLAVVRCLANYAFRMQKVEIWECGVPYHSLCSNQEEYRKCKSKIRNQGGADTSKGWYNYCPDKDDCERSCWARCRPRYRPSGWSKAKSWCHYRYKPPGNSGGGGGGGGTGRVPGGDTGRNPGGIRPPSRRPGGDRPSRRPR